MIENRSKSRTRSGSGPLSPAATDRIVLSSGPDLDYDYLIVAAGAFAIDAGWYEPVSRVRFVAHVVLLPLLVLAGLALLRRAGRAQSAFAGMAAMAFAIAAIIYGGTFVDEDFRDEDGKYIGRRRVKRKKKKAHVVALLFRAVLVVGGCSFAR